MVAILLICVLSTATADIYSEPTGAIRGGVVNGSRSEEPIVGAKVILQAGKNGFLEPVGETTTDQDGKYTFADVPIDPTVTLQVGAERDGVHYPAGRFQLSSRRTDADVRIRAFDAVRSPSPLEALRHDIIIAVKGKVIVITEALRIANRSNTAYVGETIGTDPPTTLRLSIPPNFNRVTFGSEFFGRRFRVVDHQPVTDIPWPPGERELTFTYRIPLEESGGLFRRTLDVPTSDLTLRVLDAAGKKLHCNLAAGQRTNREIIYTAQDRQLAANFEIDLQIGDPPIPWAKLARWAALATLGVLVATTVVWGQLRKRHSLEPRTNAAQGNRKHKLPTPTKRVA